MYKYSFLGCSGAISGWLFRDFLCFSFYNIEEPNGILFNRFICNKDFFHDILSEMTKCFNPKELIKGFTSFNIYSKEEKDFVEIMYMEKWNNIKKMNEYLNGEEHRKNMYVLKQKNIFFAPSIYVLFKKFYGTSQPEYLKSFFGF